MDRHLLDFWNTWFEGFAAALIWLNVRAISMEKKVNGVSLIATVYFAAVASFNIFYYSQLDQPLSFITSIFVAAGDLTYLYLFFKYRKNK